MQNAPTREETGEPEGVWTTCGQRIKETEECKRLMEGLPLSATLEGYHPHPLALRQNVYNGHYTCNLCWRQGEGPAYHCEACSYDAHPSCAVPDEHEGV